jgi:integrating conjugative element protein (TIGR03761 family)
MATSRPPKKPPASTTQLIVRKPVFLTQDDSPFPDGYSIELEENFLAPFIASKDRNNDLHPLYDRYIELLHRKEELEKRQSEWESDLGADHLVTQSEIIGMKSIGKLESDGSDSTDLHTKDALRMFIGRRSKPGERLPSIIAGKRVGSILTELWDMTAWDNPYADWALLQYEQSMKEIAARLEREIKMATDEMERNRVLGINLSIVRSKKPSVVNLNFRSPYGYAVATFIKRFDWFARLEYTMIRKGLITDDQFRQNIHEMSRLIRKVWETTSRFHKWLSRNEIRKLSRLDFIDGAPEDAAKRAEFAMQMFGIVPARIFTLAIQPSYTQRRIPMKPEDHALLQKIGRKLEQMKETAESNAPTEKVQGDEAIVEGGEVPQNSGDGQEDGASGDGVQQ